MKIISVRFYVSEKGVEHVKDWLLSLTKDDRAVIGADIKMVEYGWPLGMPLVRKMEKDLWEVRIDLPKNRIARVLFTVHKQQMVLLHGLIKKSQKTPGSDLGTAKIRRDKVKQG
jgi:phage-related protein